MKNAMILSTKYNSDMIVIMSYTTCLLEACYKQTYYAHNIKKTRVCIIIITINLEL